MTNFPTAIDGWPTITATTAEDAAGFEHDVQHTNLNDAVTALQTKVGINGSTDSASLDFKVSKILVSGNGSPSANPGVALQIYIDKSVTPRAVWLWDGANWIQLI